MLLKCCLKQLQIAADEPDGRKSCLPLNIIGGGGGGGRGGDGYAPEPPRLVTLSVLPYLRTHHFGLAVPLIYL